MLLVAGLEVGGGMFSPGCDVIGGLDRGVESPIVNETLIFRTLTVETFKESSEGVNP